MHRSQKQLVRSDSAWSWHFIKTSIVRSVSVDLLGCDRPVSLAAAAVSIRYSLQLSSSLPSGQSLKPLQRKRPMMQWTPLAQPKNVGAHLDFTFAVREKKRRWGEHVSLQQPPYFRNFIYSLAIFFVAHSQVSKTSKNIFFSGKLYQLHETQWHTSGGTSIGRLPLEACKKKHSPVMLLMSTQKTCLTFLLVFS